MSDQIPVRNIEILENEEFSAVKECFLKKYNSEPDFYVKVPGRVNLIGEHVDYSGYPVMPIALARGIVMAVKSLACSKLIITNVNSRYGDWEGDLSSQIKRTVGKPPEWYNYVLCGVKGALQDIENTNKLDNINGFIAVVSGNIPSAAGLSSSSALVCASSLSLMFANKCMKSKKDMAELCAKSERLIGTQGGGMDQAIAFLAEMGTAQHIFNWKPIMTEAVDLPPKAVFIVAHSLVEANKAATEKFNERVQECKTAAQLLAKEAGITAADGITLKECQDLIGDTLDGMIKRTKNLPSDHKIPKNRALHVFSEAQRVERFRYYCEIHDLGYIYNEIFQCLGDLMKSSHESLRTLYECSHPALDRLVELSESFGVLARLTGAGWGGCIVCLCPAHQADDYINMLKTEYYAHVPIPDGVNLDDLVFKSKPSLGAEIVMVKNNLS